MPHCTLAPATSILYRYTQIKMVGKDLADTIHHITEKHKSYGTIISGEAPIARIIMLRMVEYRNIKAVSCDLHCLLRIRGHVCVCICYLILLIFRPRPFDLNLYCGKIIWITRVRTDRSRDRRRILCFILAVKIAKRD